MDVQREQLFNNNTLINQNEQSLSLRVSGDGLEPGDSQSCIQECEYRYASIQKLKMFLHAQSLVNETVFKRRSNGRFYSFW
jgi:cell surface protein SprA